MPRKISVLFVSTVAVVPFSGIVDLLRKTALSPKSAVLRKEVVMKVTYTQLHLSELKTAFFGCASFAKGMLTARFEVQVLGEELNTDFFSTKTHRLAISGVFIIAPF